MRFLSWRSSSSITSRLSGSSGVGSEVVLLVEEESGFVPSISSISKKSLSLVVLVPPTFLFCSGNDDVFEPCYLCKDHFDKFHERT